MKLSRKTIRNILRNEYGNDKLQSRFNAFQKEKYGEKKLKIIHYFNRKRKLAEKTLKQRGVTI